MAIATLSVKLQAQIAEFQAEFKEAAKSTEKFQENFQATATKSVAYGNLIARGLEIGIGAVQQLGEAALKNASTIDDLSKKTGLSMRTIQEFQHVAGETGATVDQFANAAFKLGTNLAGGSKSVVAGVEALGLEFKDIKSLNVDEQFRTIIRALEDMDDQQEANRLGVLLFGRTYKEIAVAVAEGYTDLADGARIMSEDQVRRLAAAEVAWSRFGRTATIVSGEILASVMQSVSRATNSWRDFMLSLTPAGAVQVALEGEARDAAASAPKPPKAPELFQPKALATLQQELLDLASQKTLEGLNAPLRALKDSTDAYTQSLRHLRDELSGAALQEDVRKLQGAFKLLTDEQLRSPDVQDRVGQAAERLRQEGAKLSPELLTLAVRTEAFSKWLDDVPGQTERWAESFDALRTAVQPAVAVLDDVSESLAQIALQRGDAFVAMRDAIGGTLTPLASLDTALRQIKDIQFTRFDRFLEDLRDIGLRGANVLAEGIAEGIRTGDWGPVGQAFEDAMSQVLSEGMTAAVNFLVPGLGTILQPIFGAVSQKITSAFDFNEGRDLVQDFAKSFGGFDALQQKMLTLGADYERYWKLLNDVGRDNVPQAVAAIKAVTDALAAQERQQEETGKAATAAAREATEAQKAVLAGVQRSIDDLSREYDTLWNSIKDEAPEEVMGIIETQTRARMAAVAQEREQRQDELEMLTLAMTDSMEDVARAAREAADAITRAFTNVKVPNIQVGVDFNVGKPPNPSLTVPALASGGIVRRPTLALVGESGPEAVVPLGQLGAVAAGETTVILELDGRAVAEIAVPHLPGVIRRFVAA